MGVVMSKAAQSPAVSPFELAEQVWPQIKFYSKQQDILQAMIDADEIFVHAGNMLGKDFIAAYVALWFFIAHREVRVITTSVKDDHLRVLWGEIGRFIQNARFPLTVDKGGPLIVNHRDIRKRILGYTCPISYLRGMVSEKGEGMAGHHAAHTLIIIDEASGVDDMVYTQSDTWAKKKLIIGNPNPTHNFFFQGVKAGDLLAPDHIIERN